MATFALPDGSVVLLDDDDLDYVRMWSWYKKPIGRIVYATRQVKSYEGKMRPIYLHRELIGALDGELVDHINGNGLDNRKSNLRLCTRAENARNQRKGRGKASIYKGVKFDARCKLRRPWAAQITVGGRHFNLGLFESEEEAARAYDSRASLEFGDFAVLNFPPPSPEIQQ